VTAIDAYAPVRGAALSAVAERLAGFSNFARKDATEWFRTRRAFWTTLTAVSLILLGVLAERIHGAVDPAAAIVTDPSKNMIAAGWDGLLPIFAVFTTMGILVSERESRTLAWSLSMPLTRAAVLASKLLTSVLALAVFAVLIPDVAAVIAVRIAYGGFPDAASILWPALSGATVALFLIVLNLAVSVFFRSQRTVAAVALTVGLVVPGLIASFWPAAVPWWPVSIGDWVSGYGAGQPIQAISPVVWLASLVVLLAAAQIRFGRDEL